MRLSKNAAWTELIIVVTLTVLNIFCVPSIQPGKRHHRHLECQLELWFRCGSQKNTRDNLVRTGVDEKKRLVAKAVNENMKQGL